MGGLVENHRSLLIGQGRKALLTAFFCGAKTLQRQIDHKGYRETTNAGTNAEGPGRHMTGMSCSTQARTNKKAGSEMPGVPASEQTPRVCPACKALIHPGIPRCSLCLVVGFQWRIDSKMPHQFARRARVLCQDVIHPLQGLYGAGREVQQIADGCRDEVKPLPVAFQNLTWSRK